MNISGADGGCRRDKLPLEDGTKENDGLLGVIDRVECRLPNTTTCACSSPSSASSRSSRRTKLCTGGNVRPICPPVGARHWLQLHDDAQRRLLGKVARKNRPTVDGRIDWRAEGVRPLLTREGAQVPHSEERHWNERRERRANPLRIGCSNISLHYSAHITAAGERRGEAALLLLWVLRQANEEKEGRKEGGRSHNGNKLPLRSHLSVGWQSLAAKPRKTL